MVYDGIYDFLFVVELLLCLCAISAWIAFLTSGVFSGCFFERSVVGYTTYFIMAIVLSVLWVATFSSLVSSLAVFV